MCPKTVGPWKVDGKGSTARPKGFTVGCRPRSWKEGSLQHVEVRGSASPGLLVHLSQALNFMNVSLHQQFYEYLKVTCLLENRARLPTNCQPVQETTVTGSQQNYCSPVELLVLLSSKGAGDELSLLAELMGV